VPDVSLRPVETGDLEVFYDQQTDPEACAMAAFPAREHDVFIAHWMQRILAKPENYARTIVAGDAVAGNIVSWTDTESGHRLFGYWIGHEFWGHGIGTAALRLALAEIAERPVYADVAGHNIGSQRVLQKNGFVRVPSASHVSDDGVEELLFVLN
jgi:RimJ/RimL family protein N-acetyltransferase